MAEMNGNMDENEQLRDDNTSSNNTEEENNEYGLKDLDKLPLLEQVHRLFHAIQQKYPYTETNAWKTLPLEQKKKMLTYIREKRLRKKSTTRADDAGSGSSAAEAVNDHGNTQQQPFSASSSAKVEVSTATNTSIPSVAVKTDPYLQMLRRRSLRVASPSVAATTGHPNSAYVGMTNVALQYTENAPKKTFQPRWRISEAEFLDRPCPCGVKHDQTESDKKKTSLLPTISAMMRTFGDSAYSCPTTVQEVERLVGEYLRSTLKHNSTDDGEDGAEDKERKSAPCLRTLVEIFPEEAIYYGRWREFRSETKNEENELEDVEEEELAEELDLFAIAEADAVFNESFLERIKFADERTKSMDWSHYDVFAKGRKINFMNNKGQRFRQWLQLGKCSRASLEFMNFVAYHHIGRLVELAIKHRTGGQLEVLDSPLMKDDIAANFSAFLTVNRSKDKLRAKDSASPLATKYRRVSESVSDDRVLSVPLSSSEPIVPSTKLSGNSFTSTTPSGEGKSIRPTRLKRLR